MFSPSEALAIEVITPFYELKPVNGETGVFLTSLCDPEDSERADEVSGDPGRLQGVFLAVSKSNGTLELVDIYDQNATCQGRVNEQLGVCEDSEDLVSIRRHRFRVGDSPSTGQDIAVNGTPQLQFDTSPGTLELDGQPRNSEGPGLEPISCPESMIELWPTDENNEPSNDPLPALICDNTQAWAQENQVWDATWNGPIPNSQGGLGLLSEGGWLRADDGQFCRAGVLGETSELPTGDPDVPFYRGDQLVITSDLPFLNEDRQECQDFLDNAEDFEDRPIAFRIVNAFPDQLQLGEPTNPALGYDLQTVRDCFDGFIAYEVWTHDAYAVTGGDTGFVNRGSSDPVTGRCVLDPDRAPATFPDSQNLDPDTLLNGRAFPGTQFVNPLVSFQIEDFPPRQTETGQVIPAGNPPPAGTRVELTFAIETRSTPLVEDTNTSSNSSSTRTGDRGAARWKRMESLPPRTVPPPYSAQAMASRIVDLPAPFWPMMPVSPE